MTREARPLSNPPALVYFCQPSDPPPMKGRNNLHCGPMPNVILFGETGAGKSSILNMLDGDSTANVCGAAAGVTFSNKGYKKMISGANFRIFDTVGLNEGSAGTVTPQDAVTGLYNLITQLEDGVNLLVFVMRAPRIRKTAQQNYDMFYKLFCDGKVPIVIIVTGLEGEDNMDQWWDENKVTFDDCGMSFSGSACVTATRGKKREGKYCLEEEYEESKKKVEELISQSFAKEAWRMSTIPWFTSAVVRLCNTLATALGFEPKFVTRVLCQALQDYANLSKREAKNVAYATETSRFHK